MNLADEMEAFCDQLRRRQVEGSLPTAKKTAYLMRLLTTTRRHNDAQALLHDVRSWGTKMQTAKPFGELQLVAGLRGLLCKAILFNFSMLLFQACSLLVDQRAPSFRLTCYCLK